MKPIILIAVIFCLWVLVVVVPKSVFFKNERTPNDYYDVFSREQGWGTYNKGNMIISFSGSLDGGLSDGKIKKSVFIYVYDPVLEEKELSEMIGKFFIYTRKQVEVWDGKKWLHKGKWQEDFFKIAEGLKAEQEARDKAEKEAERKILEAYK